jgi:hypothetical protein
MVKKKIQPLGDLTQELEDVIAKFMDQHDLQHGEMEDIVMGYLERHYPGAREEYTDGTVPVRYYGHIDGLISYARGLQNAFKRS